VDNRSKATGKGLTRRGFLRLGSAGLFGKAAMLGVVAIVTLAFGLITSPYGLALLLAKSLPIYVVLFPDLLLWLPGVFDLV
jgi:hypothetical protein